MRLAFALLATEGAVASVGLVGNRVDVPLFPFVGREFSYFGSFWGNYNDLTEVIALAEAGRIKDSLTEVRFEEVNDHIDALAPRGLRGTGGNRLRLPFRLRVAGSRPWVSSSP